jgi:hypothetical protein
MGILNEKYSNLLSYSVSDVIGSAGLVFAAAGAAGFAYQISSPFRLCGSIIYMITGLIISLYYSIGVRNFFLRAFVPKNILHTLHNKSVIDVLTEPSPYTKAFILLGLSGILDNNELNELTEALPQSCDIFRLPIIQLLPDQIRSLITVYDIRRPIRPNLQLSNPQAQLEMNTTIDYFFAPQRSSSNNSTIPRNDSLTLITNQNISADLRPATSNHRERFDELLLEIGRHKFNR